MKRYDLTDWHYALIAFVIVVALVYLAADYGIDRVEQFEHHATTDTTTWTDWNQITTVVEG